MLADNPPPAWAQFVDTMDIERDYYLTFGAFLATTFTLIMPFQAGVKWLINFLAGAALPPDEGDFLANQYLPELFKATSTVQLTFAQRQDLFNKFVGMMLKIGWAFVFQEHVIPQMEVLYNIPALSVANYLMPMFNGMASKVSGFP